MIGVHVTVVAAAAAAAFVVGFVWDLVLMPATGSSSCWRSASS